MTLIESRMKRKSMFDPGPRESPFSIVHVLTNFPISPLAPVQGRTPADANDKLLLPHDAAALIGRGMNWRMRCVKSLGIRIWSQPRYASAVWLDAHTYVDPR